MEHHYVTDLEWTGNQGSGTDHYRNYRRDHVVRIPGKVDLLGSSDPTFRGDPRRHNPEDLLLTALSACHMMSYLHVCVQHGVVVTAYSDRATGTMDTLGDGSGRFREVVLHPLVTVADASMRAQADALHADAARLCFIANSVNFPVRHVPTSRAQ